MTSKNASHSAKETPAAALINRREAMPLHEDAPCPSYASLSSSSRQEKPVVGIPLSFTGVAPDPFCSFCDEWRETTPLVAPSNGNIPRKGGSVMEFSNPTVEECRRSAIRRWMAEFSSTPSGKMCAPLTAASASSRTAFGEGEESSLSNGFGDDFFCKSSGVECVSTSPNPAMRHDSTASIGLQMVGIPTKVFIPQLKRSPNMFLARLQHLSSKDFEKQKRFQHALLDIQKCFQYCNLPFFLACGTALAAHRENYFILHDDDIDLGIMFDNLVRLGKRSNKGGEPLSQSEEGVATDGLLALLSSFSSTVPTLLVFDILGTVTKGLEIRLLHTATNTRADINVYYHPISNDDEALVSRHGQFIWAASYYEESWKRKHGMYRYLHAPFESKLVKKAFCGLGLRHNPTGDELFDVPPISYLEEYFGVDWSIPKAFSYSEGIRNGYKNIIDE